MATAAVVGSTGNLVPLAAVGLGIVGHIDISLLNIMFQAF